MDYLESAKEIVRILPTLKGHYKKKPVHKISHGEYHMLVNLNMNNGSMMAGELAKCAEVTTARMTAMIKGTEEKGLTIRENVEGDRRKIRVVLTQEGRKVVNDMYEDAVECTARYLEALGPEDADNLLRIVKKTKDILK